MKKPFFKKGFTVIEVVTGVAIIGLAAALATPNLLKTRQNVSETAAKESLKAIHFAMQSYREVNASYPSDLTALLTIGSQGPAYLDERVTSGRGNYTFEVEEANADLYVVSASPKTLGVTGERYFVLDQTGTILASDEAFDVTGIVNSPPPGEDDPSPIIGF